jgi:ATP-dependent Lon protease
VKILIDEGKLDVKSEDSTGEEIYKRYDLHLHVPEGATPKDGPSAGITMVTAISSIFSEKKVDNKIAMTGEVTLTGKVLPIGGLKEKLIAAYKAGVTRVLIPKKNYERDLEEIPDEVKENIKIIPVENVEEVLKFALIK